MSHIFISYSRKDRDHVLKIVESLRAKDFKVWIDQEKIPKGEDWQETINRAIEEADAFLFMVSAASVVSSSCNEEIDCAVKNQKRILPVFIDQEEVDPVMEKFPGEKQREAIRQRNFIFCPPARDDFESAMEEIRQAILTDYAWAQYHAKLQTKALDWQRHKDRGRLLRGKELREAKQQIAKSQEGLDPLPTTLQQKYILASLKRETWVRVFLVLTALVLSGTALIAYVYKGQSEGQAEAAGWERRLARSRELADLSASLLDLYPDRSLLLGLEAVKVRLDAGEPVPPEAARALRNSIGDLGIKVLDGNFGSNALTENSPVAEILAEHSTFISDVQFSPDGTWFASSDGSDTVLLSRMNASAVEFSEPARLTLSSDATNIIRKLSFSPDGKWLAAASDAGVYLLDLSSPNYTFLQKSSRIGFLSVTFSPDSRLLVAGGYSMVQVWDLTWPASPSTELKIAEGESIWTLAISPEVQWLVAGSATDWAFSENQGSIYIWQLAELQNDPVVLQVPDGRVKSLAFSPDGRWLASASFEIRLWDMQTAGASYVTLAKLPTLAYELQFSPDGQWLAGAFTKHNFMRLWDLTANDFRATDLVGHTGEIFNIAFSADSTRLASAGLDADVRVWNLADPAKTSHVLKGNEAGVLRVAFSPNGRWLASGGNDGKVRLWALSSASLFNQSSNPIASTSLCPLDSRIAASYRTEGIKVWDVQGESTSPVYLNTPTGSIVSLSFSPRCTWLAGQSDAGEVLLWNSPALSLPPVALETETRVSHFVFSPDETSLAVAQADGTVQLWSLGDLHAVPRLVDQRNAELSGLAFSGDGRWLVWGERSGEQFLLYAWDASSASSAPVQLHAFERVKQFMTSQEGGWIGTLSYDEADVWFLDSSFENLTGFTSYDPYQHQTNAFTSFGFSPDGALFAIGMEDGLVNVKDLFTEETFALGGHTDIIHSMAFSHNNRWLATGSGDNTVRLWDLSAIDNADVLAGHSDGILEIGFTGDDRWVVTRSRDSKLVLWLADLHEVIEVACDKVSRNFTGEEWSLYFPGEPYRPTCSSFPSQVNIEEQQANQQVFDQMDSWLLRAQLMIILVPLCAILLLGLLAFFGIRKLVKYRSATHRAERAKSR